VTDQIKMTVINRKRLEKKGVDVVYVLQELEDDYTEETDRLDELIHDFDY